MTMNPAERRQSPRYAIKDNVFLTFRPSFDRIGRIKDISAGGAAFEYVNYDVHSKRSSVEVDIFSQSKDFHWAKVPCTVVYDLKVEEYPTFDGVETRRCGLRFGSLSETQLAQLNVLLSSYSQSTPLGPTMNFS